MRSFKEIIQDDSSSVFFNENEFSEKHNIDGNDVVIQIDNELLKERQEKFAEGTYRGDVLFFIRKSDFGDPPAREQIIKFDNEPMRVTDFQEDEHLYTITLEEALS